MKAILSLALVAILAVAAGCSRYEEVYSVSFRSIGGTELANGTLVLSSPLPASGTIRGHYRLQLKRVSSTGKEVEAFDQLFTGKETGQVEWTVSTSRSGTLSSGFDFMPGTVDANIVARASPTVKGYWKGRWTYSIFAGFTGVHEGGGFDVARK